jgi:hypothetical protein
VVIWYIFTRVGKLYQEKSGSPGPESAEEYSTALNSSNISEEQQFYPLSRHNLSSINVKLEHIRSRFKTNRFFAPFFRN